MSSAEVTTSLQTVAATESRPETGYADLAWRVAMLLNVFRVLLGLLLLSIFFLITGPHLVGENDPELALLSLAALLASGCIWLLLAQQRSFGQLQTNAAFAIDLITLTALMHASGGIASGFGGLLIVSVGGAALLVPRDRAFLLAALATLALLFEQTLATWAGMSTPEQFAPAGVLGAVMFIITGVVLLLRRRVAETEALAAQRGVDLRNLVELNDYIIQHLRESIVVVDAGDRVRLLNESASNQLGVDRSSAGTLLAEVSPVLAELSPVLAERLAAWRQTGGSAAPFESADGSADIQPHFASLGAGRADGLIIFLEDTSLIAERVQQMKLAALGRLSASIAHEIRNPLGALSHAGQLLAESPQIGTDERRLTDIIGVNSKRVSQIVESVLALSKGDTMRPERLELRAWASAFASEFVQTQELYEEAVAVSHDAAEVDVEMDPTHLHQVLWNLCDNAVKYASLAAGAISVELRCGQQEASGRPYLEIADRGPGVEPGKVEQIFEPFYTDQPGGTGLGLYICRELCERNGATLRYSPRPGGGSVFRIIFADPHRWQVSEKTA